ncbi:MAG: substrate-binding domain-containing protein, partial [Oscillibacter sp.]
MKRGEKRLFLTVLVIFAAALVGMMVQRVWGSDTPRVYRVSVLLDGGSGEYWSNFRAGLNQAAVELNVDLRLIGRYDGEETQAAVLRREWEGDTDGVVVIPQDGPALAAALEEAPAKLAVSVMGPALASDRVDSYVAPDYDQVGRQLATAAAALGQEHCMLYLSPAAGAAAGQIALSLMAGLQELGIPCTRVTIEPENLAAPAGAGALLAVEPTVTEALCQLPAAAGRICGVGSSSRLLHYLEDGTISSLVVQSDYDAG